ncbi:hypothetical protein GCM10023196_088900 [Actinoallomurus vinaceus]|uniref:NAD-dependent epimerase/dehydratase domain-containing protein n=1 Tax=Actinoallomurus vinaceus TaxID=1080074 RepID=A0ABP8UQG6_9ACTN
MRITGDVGARVVAEALSRGHEVSGLDGSGRHPACDDRATPRCLERSR